MITVKNYVLVSAEPKYRWKYWVMIAFGLLVGFVILLLFGKWSAQRRVSESVTYNFPCPKVQVRLGALNSGGGKLVSRLFR